MSNRDTNYRGDGISFLSLLGIAFIVLKLTNVIDWSWWLVLLPLYGGIIIWIIILLVLVFIYKRL